jgi:hypothetical protein
MQWGNEKVPELLVHYITTTTAAGRWRTDDGCMKMAGAPAGDSSNNTVPWIRHPFAYSFCLVSFYSYSFSF